MVHRRLAVTVTILALAGAAGCAGAGRVVPEAASAGRAIITDLFDTAAHTGVRLNLGTAGVDLQTLNKTRRQHIADELKEIFGDESKEHIGDACKVKDLLDAVRPDDGPDESVKAALKVLGIPSPPPVEARELVELVKRMVSADASGSDITQSAVAVGCELVDLPG